MQALKAQVKNGRLVVDEPTDLPDGAEVDVVVIDDELSAEERAALHASLDRALDDSEADAAWTRQSISSAIELTVKIVLLDEAQRRFEAEDEWWREHAMPRSSSSRNSGRRASSSAQYRG